MFRKTAIFYILILLFFTNTLNAGYLSPTKIVKADNKAYITLSGNMSVIEMNLDGSDRYKELKLEFNPVSIAVKNNILYILSGDYDGMLYAKSMSENKYLWTTNVAIYPSDIAISDNYIFVTERFKNRVTVVDINTGNIIKHIKTVREPKSLAVSGDGKLLAVANLLPDGTALDNYIASSISIIDISTLSLIKNIKLPNGSQSVEGISFSNDGKRIYASHIVSRFMFPTTQVERGWMNTNAVSIIDRDKLCLYNTVLLDDVDCGAANPHYISESEDGENLIVALSGVHQIGIINLKAMYNKISSLSEDEFKDLVNAIGFLDSSCKRRVDLKGRSPRYFIERDNKIYVSSYFSPFIEMLSIDNQTCVAVKIGDEPEMDSQRRGELNFCNAEFCYQSWQSCTSCHPDARSDGLNWDLLNDGMGNPKSSKSMLYAHQTPPSMITGIRKNATIAVRAGIASIQFAERSEEDAVDIDNYLSSLQALKSPYLEKGKLSAAAQRGEKLFTKAGCIKCHDDKYFTNMTLKNVSTGINESEGMQFDTPTLREVWRTAPYLYNGSAATIQEVLTKFNKGDRHGKTSNLSPQEIEDLAQYVLSL